MLLQLIPPTSFNTHLNTADQTGDVGTDVFGIGGAVGSGTGGTGGRSTSTLIPPHTSDKG